MSDRARYYLAGILHGAAVLLLAGWTLSHWRKDLSGAFGPTGILPVGLVPGLIVMGALPFFGAGRKGEGKPDPEA